MPYHLKRFPIPDGYRIYSDDVDVAGLQHHKGAAILFAGSKHPWVELLPEPTNKYDKNAIVVLGCWRGWWWTSRRPIGFIPRGLAQTVAESGLFPVIQPRLKMTYLSAYYFVEVQIQLVGPKDKYADFVNPTVPENIKHYTDVVEAVKAFKSTKRYAEAESLLLQILPSVEKDNEYGIAPWYHEQLAIIYRKQKRYADEVAVLERYARAEKAPGVKPEKLAKRLVKARALLAKSARQ